MLLILLAVISLTWLYFFVKFRHWSFRGVPTLAPSIPFGNIGFPPTRKRAFYESVAQTYAEFKPTSPYAGFYSMSIPHLVPCDLYIIKRILTTDFAHFVDRGLFYNEEADPLSANLFFIGGQRWRTMRQRLTSTFTSGKMQSMFPILVQSAGHLVGKLEHYRGDVREVLACFSTEVIGSCAFGLDCGSPEQEENEFRRYTRKIFEYSPGKTLVRLASMIWPYFCQKLGVKFIPADVSDFFVQVVQDTVRMRKERGLKRNDFLDLLLELEEQGLLDKKDFAAQSFVFFIAGFETSSTTLAYLLYELGRNDSVQERCRQEISDNFPDEVLTYEQVMGMKYLDRVVEETLRLYPVLPFLNRECTEDYKIDDKLTLKRGEKIIIPTLALHMDAEFFPQPEKFDPERFSAHRRQSIPSCTYLPFGEGPRKCIGLRFGLMQVKVGLVSILSKFKISTTPDTPDKLVWDCNSFTLKCKQNIVLHFESLQ